MPSEHHASLRGFLEAGLQKEVAECTLCRWRACLVCCRLREARKVQYTGVQGTRVCFHDAKPGLEEEELKPQDEEGLYQGSNMITDKTPGRELMSHLWRHVCSRVHASTSVSIEKRIGMHNALNNKLFCEEGCYLDG